MTASFYYSISSILTEDEKNEIDMQMSKNREAVYLLIKRLLSNSKLKAQKLLAHGMLFFQLSQSYVYTVTVPLILIPAMKRL